MSSRTINTKKYQISLSLKIAKMLDEMAEEKGLPKSSMIALAVSDYYEMNERRKDREK